MLRISRNFRATTDDAEAMEFSDVIMLVVATPSTGQDDRHYDTATLSSLLSSFNKAKLKNKHFVICCTVMPGYTRQTGRFLIRDCENCTLSYNPEFIAQGDVINGLLKPDMVLIGEGSKEAGDILETMYRNFVENSPQVKRMSPESAEITKLAINCFVTTKIAFANMIGDCADRTEGADKHAILSAVGADSRVGGKYLRPGYGFGGPCFPRDNRALGQHIKNCGIEPLIPIATDNANKAHTKLQADDLLNSSKPGDAFVFSSIGYKESCSVPIIEESQKLYIAVVLAKAKRKVTLRDRGNTILAVQQAYGNLFEYEVIDMGLDEPLVQQPAQSAHASRALASSDSYGVRKRKLREEPEP
jgi:UDPglucose 6-dehydrogenase